MSSIGISQAQVRIASFTSPLNAADNRDAKSLRVDAANAANSSTAVTATRITLSTAATRTSALKPFTEVTADARAALDAQYAASRANGRTLGGDSSKGDVFDLSKLDRRTVFSIASSSEGRFSRDEQIAAEAEIGTRREAFLQSRSPLPLAGYSTEDGSLQRMALATIEFYTIEASPEEAASDFAKQNVYAATYTLGITQGARDSDNSGELDEVPPLIKMMRSLAEVFARQTGPDAVSADKLAEAKSGLKALFSQVLGTLPAELGAQPVRGVGIDFSV